MGRITINKKDSVFHTKVEVSGDDWNSIERGQNIRSAGARVVKNRLDILRTKAQEYYWMLYEQGQEPDADSIRNLLTGAKQTEETLLKLFDLQNEQMLVRVGVDLTKETHSRYVLIREPFAMYLKEKHHVEGISIRKVSLLSFTILKPICEQTSLSIRICCINICSIFAALCEMRFIREFILWHYP